MWRKVRERQSNVLKSKSSLRSSFHGKASEKDMLPWNWAGCCAVHGTRLGAVQRMPGAAATEPAHSPSSCLCWSPGDGMQWASLVIAKYHLIPEVRAGWSIHRHPWSRSGAGAAEVRVELYESNWTGPCPHVLHLTLFCRKTLASRVPPSFKK